MVCDGDGAVRCDDDNFELVVAVGVGHLYTLSVTGRDRHLGVHRYNRRVADGRDLDDGARGLAPGALRERDGRLDNIDADEVRRRDVL